MTVIVNAPESLQGSCNTFSGSAAIGGAGAGACAAALLVLAVMIALIPGAAHAWTLFKSDDVQTQGASAAPAKDQSESPGAVVPPLKERTAGRAAAAAIEVRGFRVTGVGNHKRRGVTPASIQALADSEYRQLASEAGNSAKLTFAQMQTVADKIVERYRKAGFIVANAYLPAQTVGADQVIEIRVLEGKVGRIIVKGTRRYRPRVIAASAQKLVGKPLQKSEVDAAILYARDLPGVTVTSTLQPGENTGDTDLVMVAREAKRPFEFTWGANNYGTDLTGQYRALAGVVWNNPLGYGDKLDLNAEYAVDSTDNLYGSFAYHAPIPVTSGFGAVVGALYNEMQVNTGTFAALQVKGPTTQYYAGLDWKFINTVEMQQVATLHFIQEKSELDSLGETLSNEKFTVAELSYDLSHSSGRMHNVDLLQAGFRKSITDDCTQPDLVSPQHASEFTVSKLGYTRLQFLTPSQRLYFKVNGQYTSDALIPLEQFVMGGPDSARAYPVADALRDRGFYSAIEYHVDAPGFGRSISPFYGRPWREVLELEVFGDYTKGYSAGANQSITPESVTLSDAGAGVMLHVPQASHFEFRLEGAAPLSTQNAPEGKSFQIYARFSFSY